MKLSFLAFIPLLGVLGLAPAASAASGLAAEQGGFLSRNMAPEYEQAARALRDAPPQQYDFAKSNLGDVLRFLATDAKISFISLPDSAPEANMIITFSIYGSPFQVLETLCKANALSLIPENGMWYIRPADDRELIGRAYAVKNNAEELVTKQSVSAGSSNSTQQGSIQSAAVDLQGAQDTFKVARSELINQIRAILDLPLEKVNADGSISTTQTAAMPMGGAGLGGAAGAAGAAAESNSNDMSTGHRPKVLWMSDANTLYVVATRLQHMWVEGFLAVADKEQPLIAIEVKFVESSTDPTKEFGLDWSGTLGQTGNYRQVNSVTSSTTGTTVTSTLTPNTDGGFRLDAANLLTPGVDIGNLSKSLSGGLTSAVLASQDLSVKLRAMLTNADTKTTSYPRMVTLNNREVVIRSVVNTPILGGSTSMGGGTAGATTSSSVSYLPIGTVLNILPKKMEGDKVLLNMAITVSNIISQTLIAGNSYPVATSRVYSAPVEVNDGYTVAVGGMDEATEQETSNGVPLLGKIPGIGYLFKSKSRTKDHKNLMLFITPTLIDPKGGGISEEPISVVPHKPGNLLPQKPQISTSGALTGGPAAVPGAVLYLTRECDKIQATINEARSTDDDSRKLTEMKLALNQLEKQVEAFATQYPDKSAMLLKATTDIAALHDRVGKMKATILKKSFY